MDMDVKLWTLLLIIMMSTLNTTSDSSNPTCSTLRCSNFNVRGLESSKAEIKHKLCPNHDIILLQETFCFPTDSYNDIHPDFYGRGISAMDPSSGVLRGRPFGGIAILWRKELDRNFKLVEYDDDRMLGLICSDEVFEISGIAVGYKEKDGWCLMQQLDGGG